MMPMELQTEKGLKYFNYGFILYIISLALMLLLLIAFLGVLTEIFEDPERLEDPDEAEKILGPLIGMAAGFCIGLLFMFIALILFLVGLISIHGGRNEFGEKHANSVQRGVLLILMSVVIGFFGGLAGPYASSGIGIVTSIMMALGLIYLIVEISDEQGKNMLWIAGILYIVISVISAIVTLWLFTSYGLYDIGSGDPAAAEENIGNILAMTMIPMALGSLILIPILLFLLAYRRTYERVKRREIQPVMPAYPQPYPAPYPPGYPPAYPPGQQPYYPPGQPPYYPPGQQPYPPSGYGTPPAQPPGEVGIKPQEPEKVQPVQAAEQKPGGIKQCTSCRVNIPSEATVCPVCGKPQ
jgi:hypothetical protein